MFTRVVRTYARDHRVRMYVCEKERERQNDEECEITKKYAKGKENSVHDMFCENRKEEKERERRKKRGKEAATVDNVVHRLSV